MRYHYKKLGVNEEEVRKAIREVGSNRRKVKECLGKQGSHKAWKWV